ncbi:hypothetical protein ABI59_18780 [Acidobacteria bacterium Mor1]|nr:hypothetical protein ABI59_18780 [Acidobacteria bacterium Mor1]
MPHRHFKVLDARLSLEGPEAVIDPIAAAYRRFIAPATNGDAPAAPTVVAGDEGVEGLGRFTPYAPPVEPTMLAYQRFLETLLHRVGSHAILHAAALAAPGAEGGATLLAAPRGHGKSTLTLELLARGHGFLGDDYAPLDLESGEIAPYPRAIGLRPAPGHAEPDSVRRAREDEHLPRLLGKTLIDAGRLFGDDKVLTESRPLRHVILLTAEDPGQDPAASGSSIDVIGRAEEAERLDAALQAIDGVDIEARADRQGIRHWKLRTRRDAWPTRELSRVLDDPDVLFSEKHWGGTPDFAAPAQMQPVKRREAAALLGREMLNRRPGGRLLERFGGNETRLFLELAQALRHAECWRLRVGNHIESADLIEKTITGGNRKGAG